MRNYIFGGDSGMTKDQIDRQRAIAAELRKRSSGAPRNLGEGLTTIGQALSARMREKKADKADAKMRADFNAKFGQVAPNAAPLAELASSPYANKGQSDILQALMRGLPQYRNGTRYHRGGRALVGEQGPEIVDLPQGAQVIPNGITPEEWEMMQQYDPQSQQRMIQSGESPMPPEDYDPMMGGAGDAQLDGGSYFDRLGNMLPEQPSGTGTQEAPEPWMRRLNSLQFRIPELRESSDPIDQEQLRQMEQERNQILERYNPKGFEQSRFDDANSYQVADLDAFKMMQIKPEYGDVAEADINTTEGGRLSLLRRMMFADAALEDPRLAKAMTRLDNNIAGGMGALGRMYTGDDYELGRLMADTFANAVLRNDSGAQAPEPEVKRYMRQFFPLSGETDQQLQSKAALRRETIRSLMQALGGDAAPAVRQLIEEMNQLKQQADVPDGSLTGGAAAGISEEDREYLKSLGID